MELNATARFPLQECEPRESTWTLTCGYFTLELKTWIEGYGDMLVGYGWLGGDVLLVLFKN